MKMFVNAALVSTLATLFSEVEAQGNSSFVPVVISSTPINASDPIPEAFVSFSIEFAFWPDYAGNTSSPNTFSNNLLNNIGKLSGTKPYIRVGGNTQDYAIYNSSLPYAINGTYNLSRSSDYPTTIFIGPSFFDSYKTFPDTKFIHGFNLATGGNSTEGLSNLLESVPVACQALGDNLLYWEFGNEADLYVTSGSSPVRPRTWHEPQYDAQWLNGTEAIKSQLDISCPGQQYGWIAPSFAGTQDWLKPLTVWADGLNNDSDVELFSHHNYISGATSPGVTLQHTLMNHSSNVHGSINFLKVLKGLKNLTSIPFIMGETNSLYNEGAPGLSNAFGAALWGVDFNLYIASQGVRRVHMHQGTDYRYAAWQPIATNKTAIGTKPPYYGNIFVAATLGDLASSSVQVANLTSPGPDVDFDSAYAIYVNGNLSRIAAVNLREYNYTLPGTTTLNDAVRGNQTYSFEVGDECGGFKGKVGVQRLRANGSDALSGISWDGWSYNWELDEGKPVRLRNVTTWETEKVVEGVVSVVVLDSEAVVLSCCSAWRWLESRGEMNEYARR